MGLLETVVVETEADDSVRRDFFVSYTQADRAWAEWIAWVLEEDGHQVVVQAWDFVPGSNWVMGMQVGAATAARTIAVLSPDYLKSQFGAAEWQAAWASDPAGAQRKLLVARVRECDRPGLLASVVGVDLFGRTEAEAKAGLRSMVASAITGRAKPTVAPGFPGGRAMTHEPPFPEMPPETSKGTSRDSENFDLNMKERREPEVQKERIGYRVSGRGKARPHNAYIRNQDVAFDVRDNAELTDTDSHIE